MKTRLCVAVLLLALPHFSFSQPYTIDGPTSVCLGDVAVYSVEYYGCTPLSWSAGGEMHPISNNSIWVLWNSVGSKSVTVDSQWLAVPGCNVNFEDWLGVTVNDKPTSPTVSANYGYSEICTGESWTFSATLAGYSTSYGYDWYATGGLLINGSSSSSGLPIHTSTNSVTITVGSAHSSCTVYARMNNGNGCPSVYSGKTLQVGPYNSGQFYINGSSSSCPGGSVNFQPSLSGSTVTSFQWSAPGDWSPSSSTSQHFNSTVPWSFSGGVVALQLQNRCGWTGSPATKFVSSMSCFGRMIASPNPAKKSIEVTFEDSNTLGPSAVPDGFSVVLYDKTGQPVYEAVTSEGRVVLDVESLPNGIYYLRAHGAGKTESKAIIVRH